MSSPGCFAVVLLFSCVVSRVPRQARCLPVLLLPFRANPLFAAPETHPADEPQAPEPCDDAAASSPESHAARSFAQSVTADPRTSQIPDHIRSSEALRSHSSFCTVPAYVASCPLAVFPAAAVFQLLQKVPWLLSDRRRHANWETALCLPQ